MKLITKIIFLFTVLQVSTAGASANRELIYKVKYGDRVTTYQARTVDGQYKVSYRSNDGPTRELTVKEENFKFLISQAENVKGENKKQYCRRDYIEMTFGDKKVLGCIGSSTKAARALKENINFLSYLF